MIVLTPHTRLRALAGSAVGRAVIGRLLAAVAPLVSNQEHAAVILQRAAADAGWQCQFEASSDLLNLLAYALHRAMPGPPADLRHGSSEWYAEQSRRYVRVRDALNRYINAAEAVLGGMFETQT